MNSHYEQLFLDLRMSQAVVDCAAGRTRPPQVIFHNPPDWYGCPPALLPIWSEDLTYLGYWKHWFTARRGSFVRLYVDLGEAIELARTSEQFLTYVVLHTRCSFYNDIDDDFRRFASALGQRNLSDLEEVGKHTGDDPRGMTELSAFKSEIPLEATRDPGQYDGDFPTGDFSAASPWWLDACSFEVPQKVLSAWPISIERPLWLVPGAKAGLFERYLRAGDYRSAWLTLNSSGWETDDAVRAIRQLTDRVGDGHFSLLAQAWTTFAEGRGLGY